MFAYLFEISFFKEINFSFLSEFDFCVWKCTSEFKLALFRNSNGLIGVDGLQIQLFESL